MAGAVASPRNPLRNYQFRVSVVSTTGAANYVLGVKSVSGLRTQVSAWETWEGGNNLHRYANPNKVTWEPVTLEQGLALDDTFERWAEAVLRFSTEGTVRQGEPVKRDVRIDLWDENEMGSAPPTGTPVPTSPRAPVANSLAGTGARFRSYLLKNAWVSKYQPLAKLDAMSSEVALLSVELVHEGWTREIIS
jgi:phage tail-like protein